MTLIQTVAFEKAEGIVKQGYQSFKEKLGVIPKPMEMMSASPFLFESQLKRIQYYSQHPTLGFALLTHIRYLAAETLKFPFCMKFNREMLKKIGLTDTDISMMTQDPEKCMLETNETAMLEFVMKAMKEPGSVTAEDIDILRQHGWNDRDMMDALAHGVNMVDHAVMMQAFQID